MAATPPIESWPWLTAVGFSNLSFCAAAAGEPPPLLLSEAALGLMLEVDGGVLADAVQVGDSDGCTPNGSQAFLLEGDGAGTDVVSTRKDVDSAADEGSRAAMASVVAVDRGGVTSATGSANAVMAASSQRPPL